MNKNVEHDPEEVREIFVRFIGERVGYEVEIYRRKGTDTLLVGDVWELKMLLEFEGFDLNHPDSARHSNKNGIETHWLGEMYK